MTKNKIFFLQLDTNIINYLYINIIDNFILWYLRYEHLNFELFKLLKKNKMVIDLSKIEQWL